MVVSADSQVALVWPRCVANPCWSFAPQAPVSSNPAPNAVANNDFVMVLALLAPPNSLPASGLAQRIPKAARK
jgi:hypothetical protein